MQKLALPLLVLFIMGALVLAQSAKIEGRIISGQNAYLGQFPWQVIIKLDEYDDLLCGGSIISDSWVLTAAHCCYGYDSLILRFGTIDLYDDTALNMTVTKIEIHPSYNDTNYNNDVCLLQLPESLTFSSTIAPTTLVPSSMVSDDFVGTVATIAGFGITSDEYMEPSPNLLWAQVEIITNEECSDVFESGLVIDSTMCGKGYGVANMSICNGDSGGPLITKDPNLNWIQIGINSFVALDQCTEGLPSAFARLTSFIPFIQNITGIY
ncbi:brachyurin precursor [Stomoxys calcitrans]|uniref:Trypsin n=1 Tax=Stomoxys calcitrans TaxID=35570 RepID=Q7Z0B3_STOCA|nr:brachyurin precursor [Stomoxys calcitrans]AAO92746.1 trypsin [Stomoxys calcitrans]